MEIVQKPLGELAPYENNPRRISADAVNAVAERSRRMYLTYEEYAVYGGDLSETAFHAAAVKWRLSEREMAVVRTLGRE